MKEGKQIFEEVRVGRLRLRNRLVRSATWLAHANAAGSLHLREDPSGAAVLSTRPLGSGDGWEPLPLCTPVAYRAGARVFAAPLHGHEYVASPDDFRLFFTDYAAL